MKSDAALSVARGGLRAYREEMLHPTPRPGPPYTNPKTHDWKLAQITLKLARDGADVPFLKATWKRAHPGEVKDCLMVFLALKGDPEVKDAVQGYLADLRKPMRLRELAARGVGTLAIRTSDPASADLLAKTVREDVQAQNVMQPPAKGQKQGEMVATYPVRKAAVEAIRRMEKAGMLLPSYVTQAAERAVLARPMPGGTVPQRGVGEPRK